MKNLFLASLTALSLVAGAQSIQLKNVDEDVIIAPNAVLPMVTTPDANVKITFDVKNTSAATQTYTAKRYDIQLNSDAASSTTATAYFCFGGNCYGPGTFVSPNNLVLTAGQSASQVQGQWQMLIADLDEASALGLSIVKYTFANVNTAADSVQVTVKYNGSTVGLKENAKSNLKVSVFPNPSANGIVTVKGDAEFTKVDVINQLGSVIMSKQAVNANGATSLDLSDVAPGVYFIKVFAGAKSHTEKLVITK